MSIPMFGLLSLIFGRTTMIAGRNQHCGDAAQSGEEESEMIHDEKDVD